MLDEQRQDALPTVRTDRELADCFFAEAFCAQERALR